MSKDGHHHLPLWAFFFTLLAMTLGEVGLYEYWRHTGGTLMPKFAIVLVVLALTLPKAAVVMIWFMHLRYEKPLIVITAVVPMSLIFIGILPNIVDSMVNRKHIVAEAPVITGHGKRTNLPFESHGHSHDSHASHGQEKHEQTHEDQENHEELAEEVKKEDAKQSEKLETQ